MKGMVFTEFLDMVEARMGFDMVDRIVTLAELPNDGAYTAVGTYNHQELVRLVVALGEATDTPVPTLLKAFGHHLFQRFSTSYRDFFAAPRNSIEFLRNIDDHIHVEVRKLYPDAELPRIGVEEPGPGELVLLYSSPRALGDLAEGLIEACIAHYREPMNLTRIDLPPGDGGEQRVRFHLVRAAP